MSFRLKKFSTRVLKRGKIKLILLPSPLSRLPSFFPTLFRLPFLLFYLHHGSSTSTNNRSQSFLSYFTSHPTLTYLIKTLSNSHQQTIYPESFRLKLSSLALTFTNLLMALTLVHRPQLASLTRKLQIRNFSLGFNMTNLFLVLLLVLFLLL